MGGASSKQEALKDKNYDGSDHKTDPAIREGPLTNRGCTDILFLLIFWVFMGWYIYSCMFAYSEGKPHEIFRPVNGDGKLCGWEDLKDFPKLYYVIKKSEPKTPRAVCVDTCPTEIESKFKCHGTAAIPAAVCESEQMVRYGTKPLLKRFCVPNVDKLPPSIDMSSYDNLIGEFGLDDIQEIGEDLMEAQNAFILVFFTCIFVMIIYGLMIYYLTGVLVWVSIVGTGVGVLLLSLLLNQWVQESYDPDSRIAVEGATENGNTSFTAKFFQYSVYGLWVLVAVYAICICCMFKNIRISIQILKTSAVVMVRNFYVVIVPLLSQVLVTAWIGLWLYNVLYLFSTCDIEQPVKGSQLKKVTCNDPITKAMLYSHVFAFFWVFELIQACFNYVIIVATSTWYFTSAQDTRGKFSLSQGFWWVFRYNFGSMAFGSFVLAVIWIIRIVLEYVSERLEKSSGGSQLVMCIVNCCRCYMDCFHRFVKFLNENAYIQVALTSENFCPSALAAFTLGLKNAGTFFITTGIGGMIRFLGRITICIANTFLGYLIISFEADLKEDIDNPIVILSVIFLMSWAMATIFMEVYSTISLTVLQCMYADFDICNSSGEDPFLYQRRPNEMNDVIEMLAKVNRK